MIGCLYSSVVELQSCELKVPGLILWRNISQICGAEVLQPYLLIVVEIVGTLMVWIRKHSLCFGRSWWTTSSVDNDIRKMDYNGTKTTYVVEDLAH